MAAGATSCTCTVCGTVCTGRFAGCAAVWARGPREVAVNAPHFATVDMTVKSDMSLGDDADARWRLPLEPLSKAAPATKTPIVPITPTATTPVATDDAPASNANGNGNNRGVWAEAPSDEPSEIATTLESPDITARFAVAQLTELNERVEALTRLATETTEASLAKLHSELRRITSMREVDLTEQAAGIFGAVQAGTNALDAFARVVREVTDDLRAILNESLAALGGSAGLAETIAEAQADVASVREDFGAALARIERDLSVMRQRLPAKATATSPQMTKISEQQVSYIVDAVTEAVIGTLNADSARRRR